MFWTRMQKAFLAKENLEKKLTLRNFGVHLILQNIIGKMILAVYFYPSVLAKAGGGRARKRCLAVCGGGGNICVKAHIGAFCRDR